MNFIFLIYFLFLFFIVIRIQLSQFSCHHFPLPHPHPPPTLHPSCHCPFPWVLYTCSLTTPYFLLSPFLLPSGYCQFVLYFSLWIKKKNILYDFKQPIYTFQSMRGDPPKWNLFIKNCVFSLTYLNFSHIKVLSIWCNSPIKTFFPLLKTVFEPIDFDGF